MKTFCLTLTIAFLLSVSPSLKAQTKPVPRYIVTHNGFGKVKIGMTTREASKALGVRLASYTPERTGCYYVYPQKDFKGVEFMMNDSQIVRIDISGKDYATDKGARVGDSEARIKLLYKGMYEISPHKYVENGHYIEIKAKDAKYSIIFETDGKRVTSFRAGRSEEVGLVERCG